ETQGAGAASIERLRIRFERETADDLAEKDPGPVIRVDHAGVLANPTDAGMLRVNALLDRTSVDVPASFERLAGRLAHPREQPIETVRNDVVVIVAPRVPRDLRAPWICALGRIRTIDVINSCRDDDRFRRRHDATNVRAPIGRAMQVLHLARIAAIEPLAKEAK